MAGSRTQKTKLYDENMNSRHKTLRFLEDNIDTFSDYPDNKKHMIDRDDIITLNYFKKNFADKCFYTGLGFSAAIAGTLVLTYKKNIKALFFPIAFIPMPCAAAYHYYKFSQFLEYCEIKYKDRGLNNKILWEYHKKNSLRKFD
ncbi:hypothetical protein SteCoe_19008 [Stentor coeruleus]|uniref:Transmembrane protein n=1 Tax=Stentor coeruleus TaxID=5963 RepID=A0A1R2BV81_9CILI|nr:hypothetical protein SteCoe_19008 [Stentor coeruleus]